MHGLGLMLVSRRERVSGFITAILFFVVAATTAGPPHRKIIDGKEVVEPVIFGYIVPNWLFFVVGLPVIGAVWFGIHRLLARIWPTHQTIQVDRIYKRSGGGAVGWKGGNPEDGSPLDYVSPHLQTALDYLQAEEPAPMRVLILGSEGAMREQRAFEEELARWLREASDDTLRGLIHASRTMVPLSEDALWRLIEAHEERGIPTLKDLQNFAETDGSEALLEYLAEKDFTAE